MSTSTNPTERDHQLLSVGKQCSAPSCHLIDFLPFKCQHCNENFCSNHFNVNGHKCPKYDESKHNRVAPSCPLCNEPIAIPPGQDPNIRMDRHINTECSVMTGKTAKKSAPVCARGKCGKVLFAPISCDKCTKQFCASHRFPGDHNCVSLSAASTAAKLRNKPALSGPSLPSFSRPTASAARPSASTGSSSLASSSQASSSLPSISITNPFNSTDRSPSNVIINSTLNAAHSASTNSPTTDANAVSKPTNNAIITPAPTKMATGGKPINPILDAMSFVPPSIFASA